MKNKINRIVDTAIKQFNVCLNKNENEPFREIIREPLGFIKSNPKEIKIASRKNQGETEYQRKIYQSEDCWYDMELPIGQWKSSNDRTCSKRIDLIGRDKSDGRYVLCELKYKKDGAGNPFDAVLQVLAYYLMLQNNCEKLQKEGVCHETSSGDLRTPTTFDWTEVAKNVKLQVRANDKYWANWEKNTEKNSAAKQIIEECGKLGLTIEMVKDECK